MVSHDEPSGSRISGLKIPRARGAGRQSSGNRAGCLQPGASEQHQPVEVIIFLSTRQLYRDCWEHLILRADLKKEREREKVGAAGAGLCCVLPPRLFSPSGWPRSQVVHFHLDDAGLCVPHAVCPPAWHLHLKCQGRGIQPKPPVNGPH